MKKLILTALISAGLSVSAMASESAKPTEAAHTEAAHTDKKEEAKKDDHKEATSHHKLTKEEKLAKKLKDAEDQFTKLTDETKDLADAEKADAELALNHAKLELEAAKNEHLKAHASSHINKAKRFLKTIHVKKHKK